METNSVTSQNGIGPTIRISREIQCLPYAGFFSWNFSDNNLAETKKQLSIRKSISTKDGFLSLSLGLDRWRLRCYMCNVYCNSGIQWHHVLLGYSAEQWHHVLVELH